MQMFFFVFQEFKFIKKFCLVLFMRLKAQAAWMPLGQSSLTDFCDTSLLIFFIGGRQSNHTIFYLKKLLHPTRKWV